MLKRKRYEIKTIQDFFNAYKEVNETEKELLFKDFKNFIELADTFKGIEIVSLNFIWYPASDNGCEKIIMKEQ